MGDRAEMNRQRGEGRGRPRGETARPVSERAEVARHAGEGAEMPGMQVRGQKCQALVMKQRWPGIRRGERLPDMGVFEQRWPGMWIRGLQKCVPGEGQHGIDSVITNPVEDRRHQEMGQRGKNP